MLKHNSLLLIIYCIVGLLNVVGEQVDSNSLVICTKPLLAPILYGWVSINALKSVFKNMILGGLVAAWVGDVVLLMHDQDWGDLFLVGIGCFAITQILFTIGFFQIRKGKFFQDKWPIVVVGVSWFVFNIMLNNRVDAQLVIPIIIYSLLISLMLLQAWYLYSFDKVYLTVLLGASSFYVSDLMIALSKFAGIEFGIIKPGTLIMITYIMALLFIVSGLWKNHWKNETRRLAD